jgi:hypothetical protein
LTSANFIPFGRCPTAAGRRTSTWKVSDEGAVVDDLGAAFWLKVVGAVLAVCVGGFLLFWLLGRAWYAWGAFGALLVGFVIVVGLAWLYDRTHAKSSWDDLST